MWRASRPAPSAIWWRQLVPQAASSVSGGGGAHLRQDAEFADLQRHVVMLGLVAERAGHAAAGRVEGLDLELRDQPQRLGRRADRAERLLVAMAVQQRGAARHRRERQLEAAGLALGWRRIPRRAGRASASAVVSAPGNIAGNSSRKVNRQAGSSPTIGVPAAICGASASSMRRASFARLVDEAGREKRAAAAQRPADRRLGRRRRDSRRGSAPARRRARFPARNSG